MEIELLNISERNNIQQTVLTWLNTCSYLTKTATYEDLPENGIGFCISTKQSAYYLAKYVTGGYKAQYQFDIIYRCLPTDSTDNITAVQLLNNIGAWCEQTTPPSLTTGIINSIEVTSDAAILNVYEDGSKDYNISLQLDWEVL